VDLSRVVDVSAAVSAGGRSFGSGYLVAPGLVLTAWHVVCDDKGQLYADPIVRFLAEDTVFQCRVAWAGRIDLDGALLELTGSVPPCQPVRWGQLVSSEVGIICEAAGFPVSMEQDDRLRDVEHLRGEINAGTGLLGGRIYVDVTSARPQPGDWYGMSGAAVWSGPLLVGVVAWDATAFAAGRLAAEPVTRLLADPGFRALIGPGAVVEAVELAQRRPRVAVPAPAYLLRADAETARFRSRAAELAKLTAWCSGSGARVRLLTGAGGQGKTRLARELARRLAAAGTWAAELLASGSMLPSGIRQPLLVVIDYAETRPQQVQEIILAALSEPGHTPIRVLLLARSAGDWWDRLRTGTAELEMALAGAIVEELAPLEDTAAGRRQAFSEALVDYEHALAAMDWPCTAPANVVWPDLADDTFGSPLRLQMTALAALLGDGMASFEPPEDVILRHEARYWIRTAAQNDLHLHEESLRYAVTAATLCGAADQLQAVGLLRHVPRLRDQSEDTRVRTAGWLRDLYATPADPVWPAANSTAQRPYWGSLEPDIVAEHLVAQVIGEMPGFLPQLLEETSEDQDHQALTVLARSAAAARPHTAESLSSLLSQLPRLAPTAATVITQSEQPTALITALTRLVEHEDLPVELLAAISEAIPRDTQALSRFAVTIEHDLLAVREQLAEESPETYLPDLAISLTNLTMRLGQTGGKEGLAVAQRAVAICERLAEESPDAFLLDLARSLNNLSAHLSNAGRHDEALAAIQRAVAACERLAEESPEASLPTLAGSLNNLVVHLGEAGRYDEALAAAQRAVDCWGRLASENPDAHLTGLAWSLSNLARCLAEAGRCEEALAPAQRAADLYEPLVEESPDAHTENLAWSLENLARRMGEAGRREQAVAAAQRAVDCWDRLAEESPDAHLENLARSLENLAADLDGAGRREEALVPAQRAVNLYEGLAEGSPDAHLENLARSLENLAADLDEAGRRKEAQAAAQRAVGVYRRLGRDPEAYLSVLATPLNMQSMDRTALVDQPGGMEDMARRLRDVDRREEGLAAIQRAVAIAERLAEANPDKYVPDLAAMLSNLSGQLGHVGRREEALAAIQRAVAIWVRLAEASPDAYLPDLAASLSDLSQRLGDVGRREEGLATVRRAVDIDERLAEASPDAYLPDLATSLNNLAHLLGETGRQRPDEALAVIRRAVAIRERLAEANPDAYLPDLAVSLSNLSIVLGGAGWPEEALMAVKRAIAVQEPLAKASPNAYLPDLAMSLVNLSLRLGEAGRPEEGLAAIQRAIAIQESLAQVSPDAYLPSLAMSLTYLSLRLGDVGRPEEALAAKQRAITMQEPLAQASPDAFLPDLAASLNNVSVQLAKAGRPKEALAAIQRAVDGYERLAGARPDAYLPYLATSLINLSLRLRDVGRPEESLAAKRRAITIQERLAEDRPDAYLPELAASLNKLSMDSKTRSPQPRGRNMDTGARSPGRQAGRGSDKCDWPTCKFAPSLDAEVGLYRGWCWRHGRYRACYLHLPTCPRCEYRHKLRAERGRTDPAAGDQRTEPQGRGVGTTDLPPIGLVKMELVPEICDGTRLVIAMTNGATLGSFYAEIQGTTYEPFLGVISETPRRRIAWVDDISGAPRQLGTAETTRLYLGRLELASPGGDRSRASFCFAWPVQTNYTPKPRTLIRVKVCVMRAESSDSATASFDLGVDHAGNPIFRKVEVSFEP
jgi:tetratricopeptide (TPR) repeat protein